MKIKNAIFFLLGTIILFFSSCKEDLNSDGICGPDILYFRDMDEFKSEMEKVLQMTSEERDIWEQEKGFKSFGIAAEKFYKSIDQEKFKSIDEFKQFVNNHSKYIQLIEENGDYILETQFYNNPCRYFMNEEGMYQIGENLYRIVKSGTFYCKLENYDLLKDVDTDRLRISSENGEVYCFISESTHKSSSLGCGTGSIDNTKKEVDGSWYMTKMELGCKNEFETGASEASYYYKITSYKRGFLWIYYLYSDNITFSIKSKVKYLNENTGYIITDFNESNSVVDNSIEGFSKYATSSKSNFDSTPCFLSFNCTANNSKTDNLILSCASN